MLPAEPRLEVRQRLPAAASRKPPLLFVHGGYCDAWFWEPYFLPWFAARGYAAYAVSLRGHGASGGAESLFIAGLADYETDVERVGGTLPSPPILIGHSMGAAVVELIVAKRPVRGAALVAPLPPAGLLPIASRLATSHLNYFLQIGSVEPRRLSADVLQALRPYYFSDAVAPELLDEASRHLGAESPRALFDLSLRMHWGLPREQRSPLFVLGAEGDLICTPDDVRATARHHNVEATILPGLAHLLMLEPQWLIAAKALDAWVATLD
jgi:pimeloyl-ACP methyl ester carboxylesterase